jgi:hypothetical protein
MPRTSVSDLEIAVKHLSQHIMTEECGIEDEPAISRVIEWIEHEIARRNIAAIARETGATPKRVKQFLAMQQINE